MEEAAGMAREKGPVHVLLTDVVMPGLSGHQVFEQVSASQPGIRVVFMSGYTDNVVFQHGVIDPSMNFIQKPFTAESLDLKLREALER